jgi:2-polyprenyl-3-methyl-5-hydroxy-6-metoxy-1,4-benzoquinol methylase
VTSRKQHWEAIYSTKGEDELSWHQEEPKLSLRLISAFAAYRDRIIDIGGGTSLLARRLLEHGFEHVTVLDIAGSAIESGERRAGGPVAGLKRRRADVTTTKRVGRFDVWHDRAVFHFLAAPKERLAYVNLARRTVPVGGHVIIATFALDGPEKCSGLDVVRYDAAMILTEFSPGFILSRKVREVHTTPWGTTQPFSYVVLERVRSPRLILRSPTKSTKKRGGRL